MALNELGVVRTKVERPDRELVDRLSGFGVATVHEAMGRVGLMRPYIRPVYSAARVCGPAVTVLLQPGDNWMLHVAAEQVRDGDVLVAACTTECEDGFFGDLLATSLRAQGCRALEQFHGFGELPLRQPRARIPGHRVEQLWIEVHRRLELALGLVEVAAQGDGDAARQVRLGQVRRQFQRAAAGDAGLAQVELAGVEVGVAVEVEDMVVVVVVTVPLGAGKI